jgi:hypothetical protein
VGALVLSLLTGVTVFTFMELHLIKEGGPPGWLWCLLLLSTWLIVVGGGWFLRKDLIK